MSGLVWSFVLSGIGVVGIILAGSKYKLGWLIGFFVQPLWIVFAVTTGQYGFILNAVIYAVVYARNWLRWRREESAQRLSNESGFPGELVDAEPENASERPEEPGILADSALTRQEIDAARALVEQTKRMEHELAGVIWNASRRDEGSISAMGADIIARTILGDYTIERRS